MRGVRPVDMPPHREVGRVINGGLTPGGFVPSGFFGIRRQGDEATSKDLTIWFGSRHMRRPQIGSWVAQAAGLRVLPNIHLRLVYGHEFPLIR